MGREEIPVFVSEIRFFPGLPNSLLFVSSFDYPTLVVQLPSPVFTIIPAGEMISIKFTYDGVTRRISIDQQANSFDGLMNTVKTLFHMVGPLTRVANSRLSHLSTGRCSHSLSAVGG